MNYKNAVITGACGGFGQALARTLLQRGARVALLGLDAQRLAELVALAPERAVAYTPDVTDSAAMQAVATDWHARFGTPDLVIANAGVAGGFDTAESADLAVFRRMLEINLLSLPTTFQPFLAAMREAGRGTLCGVASIAAWRGLPGNGAYCASKAGVVAYLQSLRAELRGTGLTVSTCCPGYLRTQLTAGNRFAMPGLMEPADAARMLVERLERGDEWIVLPRRAGWLARTLMLLPDRVYDRILGSQPRKPRAGEAGATPIPGLDAKKN